MHLIKKSRRLLSNIFHTRPDSNPTTTSPRSKASRSRRRRLRRRTSSPLFVARRTMDRFICKGEKRKRESLDDGEDDEWEFVQCKKRLVGRDFTQSEGVGEEHTELDDVVRCVNDILYSQPFLYEDSSEEPGELPDDYEELLGKVHSSLENLTLTDTHNSSPSSRASTHQTYPEPHTDIDYVWLQGIHDWENRYRPRRCHSETSTRILSYANALTGELPDGSGRRSAPPNLDTAWGVPGQLDRRASLGSVSVLSEDETLDGVFDESALEMVLFAASEAGDQLEGEMEEHMDAYVEEEAEEIPVGIEVGDADTEAAMAAVAEANLWATTWQVFEATTLQAEPSRLGETQRTDKLEGERYATTLREGQVANEPAGQREPESGYSSEPVSEHEQEPASTQPTDPSSASSSPLADPNTELAFRRQYDSLVNWGLDAPEVKLEPRVRQRQVTAEDVASRIRAVKDKMMESLLDIEQRLRPHCSETPILRVLRAER
ncbi:hypothetical protein V8C44DRAFT_284650 [Trichoderma aethiopicum]